MNRVLNKVAIITGAASGLGKADAMRLSDEGAKLVLTDINVQEGKLVAKDCKNEALFFEQDVSQENSWPDLIKATISEFGKLDILVNNAGIAPIGNIESTTTDQWHDILKVNLDSVFFGCRAVIPEMSKSGGGSIINMSSTTALVGLSPYLAYSAAKGGIRSMTKSIAMHCQEQKNNIRCNSIHPSGIVTPMVLSMPEKMASAEMAGKEDRPSRASKLGEPRDIAYMALYLASDESKFVNGAAMRVDNSMSVTAGVVPEE